MAVTMLMEHYTLAKACDACIRAKKKCDKRLPVCQRCTTKRLACRYKNEPLAMQQRCPMSDGNVQRGEVSDTGLSWRVPDIRRFWPFQNSGGANAIGTSLTLYQLTQPDIFMTLDEPSFNYLVSKLQRCPQTFARYGSTPFLHASMYRDDPPHVIQIVREVCSSYRMQLQQIGSIPYQAINPVANELLNRRNAIVSYKDSLAFVQALLMVQILTIFSRDLTKTEHAEAERRQKMLEMYTQELWSKAPGELSIALSPVEAYIFAEAVRRTILASHMVEACYKQLRYGIFVHSLFVEALPFGSNIALWELDFRDAEFAPSDFVRTEIQSYREFVDLWNAGLIREPTLFEKMLLVGCKGYGEVKSSLEGDLDSALR